MKIAKQTFIAETCEVSDELYSALIEQYDICGNKHNWIVTIKYLKYILTFISFTFN